MAENWLKINQQILESRETINLVLTAMANYLPFTAHAMAMFEILRNFHLIRFVVMIVLLIIK